eukprot:TRINITY_DN3503_c0_g1_i1.p1 TRINITY_DN3503_c0_g1~~TRINITY_DN3503_c0_g1_i1.p1  ORF type:complete len:586 (-),score=156.89 TRINITY_DN3503_c0_g1_i1:116-1624(-)
MCLLGCGVSTGWGAVYNTTKVEPNSSVAVFGLGALGLSVIQAAKTTGARYVVGVDINDEKFAKAVEIGATECVNSLTCEGGDVKSVLMAKEKWGYDYTFDCTGNVNVMRTALEVAHRGWGESCVIGVAAAGKEISTRPFQLVTGRNWKGTAFGGWKARTEVPKLVQTVMRGEMALEPFITHTFKGLENVNESIDALHSGKCLRAVVQISESKLPQSKLPTLKGNIRVEGGWMKQLTHWSDACNCEMTFSVYLPDPQSRTAPPPPVLYYLSGLTCSDENARTKSHFAAEAGKVGLAVVFPDTSPRGVGIPTEDDDWQFGSSAGWYLDATVDPWSKHYKMYTYITKELPSVIAGLFPVDPIRRSITGHSMGGHGALICHLKNPGMYTSVSAFAPACNPTAVPWGEKVFPGYLGSLDAGKAYDATELVKSYSGPKPSILIDVGTHDWVLTTQLKPENFSAACGDAGYPLQLRMQPNYDHSYYFVSTFMRDHVDHHARALGLRYKM